MIEILGNHFGAARLDLKDVAPIARKAGVPILVDAAADYLIVPNPYLALGADLVAYSGGKIIRGPQTAGLLVGRRDLVRRVPVEDDLGGLGQPERALEVVQAHRPHVLGPGAEAAGQTLRPPGLVWDLSEVEPADQAATRSWVRLISGLKSVRP